MKAKKPTQKEKIEMYEQFIDRLALYAETGNTELVQKLIYNASSFSYAHRAGNGELSEKEQDKLITTNFWELINIDHE